MHNDIVDLDLFFTRFNKWAYQDLLVASVQGSQVIGKNLAAVAAGHAEHAVP